MKIILYLIIITILVSCAKPNEKIIVNEFLNEYVKTNEYVLRGEIETGSLKIRKSQFISENLTSRENYDFVNLLLLTKNNLVNYNIKDTLINGKKTEIYRVNVPNETEKLIINEDSVSFNFKIFELRDLDINYYEKRNDTFWIKAIPKEVITTSIYDALDNRTKAYIKKHQSKRFILTKNGHKFKIIKGIIWE